MVRVSVPTHTMSKRDASGSTFKTRKRRKNGVSSSSSVLDAFDTVPSKPRFMRVWHTNTTDPTTSRQSVVQISSEPHVEEANTESIEETSGTFTPPVNTIPARPKRKRGNDSVSRGSIALWILVLNIQIDKDEDIPFASTDYTGRTPSS